MIQCVCVEEGVGRLLGVRVAERKGRQQGGANVCACREGRTLFFAEVRVVERSSTGGRRGSGGQSQCRTSTNGCVEPRLCMRHGSKNQGFFAVDAHRCVCVFRRRWESGRGSTHATRSSTTLSLTALPFIAHHHRGEVGRLRRRGGVGRPAGGARGGEGAGDELFVVVHVVPHVGEGAADAEGRRAVSEDDLGASHEAARLDEFAERLPDDRGREGREGVHPCGGSGLGSCAGACSALFGPALRRRGLAVLVRATYFRQRSTQF